MKLMTRMLFAMMMLVTATGSAFAQRKFDERRAVVPAGFIRIFANAGSIKVVGLIEPSVRNIP